MVPRFSFLDWFDLGLMSSGILVIAVLLVYWWRRGQRDPLRGAPIRANTMQPIQVWLCMVGYLLAGFLAIPVASLLAPSGLSEAIQKAWQGILNASITQTITVALCLAVAGPTFIGGLRGLGLRRLRLGRDLLVAGSSFLAASYLCSVIAWYTQVVIAVFWPGYQPPAHGVFSTLASGEATLLMRVLAALSAVVLAPLGEEIFYRGVMQTALKRVTPPRRGSLRHRWVAIAITAVLFGLMHLNTPQFIPALICLGVVLGYLYERTGSLWPSIILHVLFNAKSLVWFYLQEGL